MFTMCILLSTLTTKGKGICKGASKLSPDLKNYTALGTRTPGSKIPGSATGEGVAKVWSTSTRGFNDNIAVNP